MLRRHPGTAPLLVVLTVLPGLAADTGWQLLFDGTTPSGWLEVTGKAFPTGSWRIEDGCLRAFSSTEGMQDIRTAAVFRDFDLEFEWKIEPKGNSGVKYLVQRVDEWTPEGRGRQARARGLEYQLADDANEEALQDASRVTASLYSAISPSPRLAPLIGRFNQSRIVVKGTHVEHWLNGTRVLTFDTAGPEVLALLKGLQPKSGPSRFATGSPICLQNHNSPVWFRNLRIRRPE